ncbi:MAG: hypothetical protein ACRDFC_09030, partial [Ignavibacteria bacterium]
MKKIILTVISIFFISNNSFSQIEEIFKKIPGIGDVFEEAVTTSIKDAYPTAQWLKELDNQLIIKTGRRFKSELDPGFYRFKFKTFCLHAGTYAPTEGAGYLVAPLKGSKAKLISSILSRYPENSGIEQKDVQMLIWGIEAGQKFSNYPIDFQLRITPLLKPEEIALMEVDVKDIAMELLPDDIKNVLNLYRDMRNLMSSAQSTYEDIERLAVRTGIAPLGKGSKNIGAGIWTSVGNGIYVRSFPNGYTESQIEIYIPADVKINRDSQNKIQSLVDGTNKIEVSYEGNKIGSISMSGAYGTSSISPPEQYSSDADAFVKLVKGSLKKKKASRLDIKTLSQLKAIELSLKYTLGSPETNDFYRLSVDAINNLISEAESGMIKGGSRTGFNPSDYVYAPANTSNQRLGSSGSGEGGEEGTEEEKGKEKEKEKEKDCKVSVSISQVNESELPKPDWVYSVSVNIFIEGDDEKCVAEEISFTLFDVSKERGRFMNDHDKYDDMDEDLQFSDLNQGYQITKTTATKQLSGKSQTAQV